ncbi:MAG: hypothetical protein HIU81_05375 [Acidobacteria bacterium]|nr:hypothetical protein [Acidobacteriota bacterium]
MAGKSLNRTNFANTDNNQADFSLTTNFLKDATSKAMPLPYVTPTPPVNVGAAATFTTNAIFDNRNNAYKFQPLAALTPDVAATVQPATFTNMRADHPADVGGNLKIASFNVQNYFPTTGDPSTTCKFYTDRDGNPVTVSSGCDQRGAANAENLRRQQDKIAAGIINSTTR